MRLSNGSSGFERKVRSPSKTLAIYEPSGLVIASSKPKKTKSWQRLVQVKSATLRKAGRRYYARQYGRFPIKKLCGRPQDYLKGAYRLSTHDLRKATKVRSSSLPVSTGPYHWSRMSSTRYSRSS